MATTTTTTQHLKVHQQPLQTQSTSTAKPKRRRCRATAATSTVEVSSPDTDQIHSFPPDSPFRVRFSPDSLSPLMDYSPSGHLSNGFTKFNSVLTAGLLNPMSPPPPPDKTRSSPTLFEMMASEPDIHPRVQIPVNPLTLKPQVRNLLSCLVNLIPLLLRILFILVNLL